LHIGCGNSNLPEELFDNNIKNIINVDFSDKTVKEMAKRAKKLNRLTLEYKVMDIFDMKFDENKFDVVLDKGTLDAIFP
jgi:2-polyprenyl-3-methyl-5-hydroxy-6-metoxy-1,4-benzoquinol methylase